MEVRVDTDADLTGIKKAKKGISDFSDGVHKSNTTFGKLRDGINKHSFAIGAAITGMGALAVREMGRAITAASDLEESINAVNVIFGEGAETVLEFGKTAAQAAGLSTAAYNQMASITGALLKDTALSATEAGEATNELAVRAADMASVMNTTVADAMSSINQALRGETEAIRRYSGDVTVAALEQYALSQGIETSVESMSEQEKRLLRLGLIMQQTEKFAGDFGNTSDSLANKQRITAAEMENLRAKIGEDLMPIQHAWMNFIKDSLIPTLFDFGQGIKEVKLFAEGVGDSFQSWIDKHPALHAFFKAVTEDLKIMKDAAENWLAEVLYAGDVARGQGNWKVIEDGPLKGKMFREGQSIYSNEALQFDKGGVVPGPIGSPQMAVVHGGETILPTHKGGSAGGDSYVFNITEKVQLEEVLQAIDNRDKQSLIRASMGASR